MTDTRSNCARMLAVVASLTVTLCSVSAQAAPEPDQRMIDKRFGSFGRAAVVFDRPGSDFRDDGYATAEQADGKLVLAGVVALPNGRSGIGVTRLTRNGDLDATFGDPGTPGRYVYDPGASNTAGAYATAVQSDDKIIVAGWIAGPAHNGENFLVVRLTANGTLDTSFGLAGRTAVAFDRGGSMDDWATSVAIQNDGRIVVAGNVQRGGVNDRDIGVVRLNATGGADSGFGDSGKTVVIVDRGGDDDAQATSMVVQGDGKIAIGGWASTTGDGRDLIAVRLLPAGPLDNGFGTGGLVQFNLPGTRSCHHDEAWAIQAVSWTQVFPTPVVQRRLLLAGTSCIIDTSGADDWDALLVRLHDNGSPDTSLNGTGYMRLAVDLGGFNRDIATGVLAYNQAPLLTGLFAPSHMVLGGSSYDARVPGDRGNQMAVQMIRWEGAREAGFGVDGKGYIDFDYGGANYDWGNGMILSRSGAVVMVGTVERATGNDYDFAATRILLDRIFAGDQEND